VESFVLAFGEEHREMLPEKRSPWVREIVGKKESTFWVNNAFWAQGIANVMNAPVVAGMEDVEVEDFKKEIYSGALYFAPFAKPEDYPAPRYSKQVLVPMAEYIPTSFCKQLAAMYGISGSFTCGCGPVIFDHATMPFGLSICYEETFGNITRLNRDAGAKLLVNLTSDVWFPESKLPKQHLDHARLRTVENGIPLLRACNTGITCALDSLGRVTHTLNPENPEGSEWAAAGLVVSVPTYTYQTLYSKFGDLPLIIVCAIFIFCYSIIPTVQRYRK
jgi:apolipoprotein N-acyltransferase